MQRTLNVVGQPSVEALVIPRYTCHCEVLGKDGVFTVTYLDAIFACGVCAKWCIGAFLQEYALGKTCFVLRHQGLVPVLSSVA